MNRFHRFHASIVFAGALTLSAVAAHATDYDPLTAEIPLVNWSAPQYIGGAGVTSSMPIRMMSSKVNTKTDLGMSVFTAINPCRLVDTRNAFNPAIVTPGATPFAAGETRTYQAAGLCGLPVGAGRIFAISIAITTLPAANSGDIETVPHGATLGGTVDMVVQANQWNSVSKVVRVDANGAFDTQVRITSGHLAIDINGYYADVSDTQTGDFYSVRGSYAIDGGLFYSQNNSAIGAAVRAFNSAGGADVGLAKGSTAIDISAGDIRVRNAGNNTDTPAFIHLVQAGNLCADTRYTRLIAANVSGADAASGQILFVQEASHAGTIESTPKAIRAVFASNICSTAANAWYLFSNTPFAAGETYNVLVINP